MQIIALDPATPQLRAPPSGAAYAAPRPINISPESLTGSAATSSLSIAQTWNTTGTPTAIQLDVADTASNAASLLMNLRVGGVSRFSIAKAGVLSLNAGGGAGGNGSISFADRSNVLQAFGTAFGVQPLNVNMPGGLSVVNDTGQLTLGTSLDVRLARDAANTLALRNGVNAQAFNIYNTFTDASNYERGFVRWSSNRLQVGSEALGTGSQRDLDIQGTSVTVRIGTTNRWFFYASNHFGPAVNATQDFGTSTLRIRDFYQGGFHEMAEQTAPSAPAANNVRIYAEDNGAGKTRLMALFATGAAQQIAIEP